MTKKIIRNGGTADLKNIPIPGGTIDLLVGEEKVVDLSVSNALTKTFKFVQSRDYEESLVDSAVVDVLKEVEKKESKETKEVDLEIMTKKELVKYGAKLGLDLLESEKKVDLIKEIESV